MIGPKCFTRFVRLLLVAPMLVALAPSAVHGQALPPPSDIDIWQIGRRELEFLNEFQLGSKGFLVEVYAQYLAANDEVVNDSWNMARVSSSPNGLTVRELELLPTRAPLQSNTGLKKTWLFHLHKPPKAVPIPESPLRLDGVVPMIFLDSSGIGMDRYSFQYLGIETLGSLRAWTFLLKPKQSAGAGAFSGKIWVVDHDIVRFSGTFLGSPPHSKGAYVSFDSVRFKAPTDVGCLGEPTLTRRACHHPLPASRCVRALPCGASIHEPSMYQGLLQSSQTKTSTQRA